MTWPKTKLIFIKKKSIVFHILQQLFKYNIFIYLFTFSHCPIDVKLLLIKCCCTSFYYGYMWSDYKKTMYSKLRVGFNNVFRRVLGLSCRSSASTIYTTHNIINMNPITNGSTAQEINLHYNFIERFMDSSNMIINTLMNSWYIRFSIWEFWNSKLYVQISSYIEYYYVLPLSHCQLFSLFIFILK